MVWLQFRKWTELTAVPIVRVESQNTFLCPVLVHPGLERVDANIVVDWGICEQKPHLVMFKHHWIVHEPLERCGSMHNLVYVHRVLVYPESSWNYNSITSLVESVAVIVSKHKDALRLVAVHATVKVSHGLEHLVPPGEFNVRVGGVNPMSVNSHVQKGI